MTLRNSAALATLISISSVPTVAQNNAISWWAFDAGFGIPNSSTAQVKSAVGQSFVGLARQSPNQIESGFLVDTLLRGTIVGVAEENPPLPEVYSLSQNYPNPFNPTTVIRFALPQASEVTLNVYDLLGRRVTTLVDGEQSAGYHSVEWNGTNSSGNKISSGVYFYRIEARSGGGIHFASLKKMLILK
ncbi:MAG: Por secretion system C-terminal sorting protein [Bacteroidetes bacterium]|nr:Por secretion system C-terminal sorting protein [Bacteroidota bacterium]